MYLYYILSFAFAVFFPPGDVWSSDLSLLNVLDNTGKNLCIEDLHCFLDTNQDAIVSANLTLDKDAVGWKFRVTIEKIEEPTVVDKEYNMCWDQKASRMSMIEKPCVDDVVPASPITHAMVFNLHVPFFKDLALLHVKGPEEVVASRGLVSHHSSYLPITIPDCGLGPC